MSTIQKCDKCKKIIKGKGMRMSINDDTRSLFEKPYYYLDYCPSCALKISLQLKKIINKKK